MAADADPIHRIEREIVEHFAPWGIALPEGAAARREPGHIYHRGWHIGWLWGEEFGEEYFEYLSQHRMTNDTLTRQWLSGGVEALDAPNQMIVMPSGSSDTEEAERCAAHAARERALCAELRARGLLPPAGANLGALEIQELLRST